MKVTDSKSTIAWYDENAEQYASNLSKYPAPQDLSEKFLDYLLGSHILDAGCAGGRDTAYFTEQGYQVTGLDLSEGLITTARIKHPKCTFVVGDFRELPFQDKEFDGVWAHASLVHMDSKQDTEDAIKEFARVLNDDGILYIFVKTSDRETDIVNDKLSGHDRFFRYYNDEEISLMLSSSGFNILESFPHDDPAGRDDVKWLVFYAQKA